MNWYEDELDFIQSSNIERIYGNDLMTKKWGYKIWQHFQN
jgi:hypothetical protein